MSGSITKLSIDRVKESTDIVDLIGQYVSLKKAGVNFIGICPFHNEKTPSFNVSPARQMFHCFGCQKGGDALGFLMEHEGLGFVEAVEKLAQRQGIELEYEKGKGIKPGSNKSEKDQIYSINERVTEWWQRLLTNDNGALIAREYLSKRGISSSAQNDFRIGYSPENWDQLIHWGKSKGYEVSSLVKAGLIKRHEESGRYYSRFRGRLMFPICDLQGRIIGFSARILSQDKKGAKYINSPETAVFKKSRVLFGIDKARKPILDQGYCVICEGQLDTISLHQAGIKNVIAPQGTAFGEGHISMIKKLTNEVVLCFDSDEAGQNASAKVWRELLENEMEVSVIRLPEGHDPDSFVRENGIEAFEKLVKNRENYVDFLIKHWISGLDLKRAKGKQAIAQQMGAVASSCKNPIMTNEIARKTALVIGEKTDLVKETWSRQKSKPTPFSRHQDHTSKPHKGTSHEDREAEAIETLDTSQLPKNEYELIKVIMKCSVKDLKSDWFDLINNDWLNHSITKSVISCWRSISEDFQNQENIKPHSIMDQKCLDSFFDTLVDKRLEAFCRGILVSSEPILRPNEQMGHILTKLRNKFLDNRIIKLNEEASNPNQTNEQIGLILRLQQELREEKKSPITESTGSDADYF